jgi:hypothetical protein
MRAPSGPPFPLQSESGGVSGMIFDLWTRHMRAPSEKKKKTSQVVGGTIHVREKQGEYG